MFSLTTDGVETVLHGFGGSDGASVYAGLLNVKGRLYGTTLGGEAGACAIGDVIGCGVVFSLSLWRGARADERVGWRSRGWAQGISHHKLHDDINENTE